MLATGTFTDESTTGWQTLTFPTPVTVRKNTTYVASYRTTVGRYSATPSAFAAADLSRPPLRVTSTAGAYTYGTGFPNTRCRPATSWTWCSRRRPRRSRCSRMPAPGAIGVPRGTTVRVGFTAPVAPGWSLGITANGSAVTGTASLSGDGTSLVWTPSTLLPPDTDVTVTLSSAVSQDGATLPTQTWTFRTRGPETVDQQTLFGDIVPGPSRRTTVHRWSSGSPGAQPQRARQRDPLLQGSRQQRHPHRLALERHRYPPRRP